MDWIVSCCSASGTDSPAGFAGANCARYVDRHEEHLVVTPTKESTVFEELLEQLRQRTITRCAATTNAIEFAAQRRDRKHLRERIDEMFPAKGGDDPAWDSSAER